LLIAREWYKAAKPIIDGFAPWGDICHPILVRVLAAIFTLNANPFGGVYRLKSRTLFIPVTVKRLAVLIPTCRAFDATNTCDFDHLA
jgi:hypothetical protein